MSHVRLVESINFEFLLMSTQGANWNEQQFPMPKMRLFSKKNMWPALHTSPSGWGQKIGTEPVTKLNC